MPHNPRMVSPPESAAHRPAQFARLAGVTVRTLHHYDRVGVLKPHRTRAGHRTYSTADLETLRRIVALKAIGVPLKEMVSTYRAGGAALADALRRRRRALEDQQHRLAQLIDAVRKAEAQLGLDDAVGLAFAGIVTAVDAARDQQEWRDVARDREWEQLLHDIAEHLDEDPKTPAVQALASRWIALTKKANSPDVPIATILRVGQSNLRFFEERSPKQASPWRRAVTLMSRAASMQLA
jgi:DNA-binding transcriptional MerR regulator